MMLMSKDKVMSSYSFPELGRTVEAESLEEAHKIASKKEKVEDIDPVE